MSASAVGGSRGTITTVASKSVGSTPSTLVIDAITRDSCLRSCPLLVAAPDKVKGLSTVIAALVRRVVLCHFGTKVSRHCIRPQGMRRGPKSHGMASFSAPLEKLYGTRPREDVMDVAAFGDECSINVKDDAKRKAFRIVCAFQSHVVIFLILSKLQAFMSNGGNIMVLPEEHVSTRLKVVPEQRNVASHDSNADAVTSVASPE